MNRSLPHIRSFLVLPAGHELASPWIAGLPRSSEAPRILASLQARAREYPAPSPRKPSSPQSRLYWIAGAKLLLADRQLAATWNREPLR